MPSPVEVSIEVPQTKTDVFAYLDVMANHESFTDHMLVDWTCSGPDRGLGAKARVRSKPGRNEVVDIEVIEVNPPEQIVERNVSGKGKRVATGTYDLAELPDGGTRITFTYAWKEAPFLDKLLSPVVRGILQEGNQLAMVRLADELTKRVPGGA